MSHANCPGSARLLRQAGLDEPNFGHAYLPTRFRALVIYANLIAARKAMDRLVRMIRRSHRSVVLHPMLWRVDQLSDSRWQDQSLGDACSAEWIVIATKSSAWSSAETENWLKCVLARKNGGALQLLALSEDEDPWMISIEQPAALAADVRLEAGRRVEVADREYLARSA